MRPFRGAASTTTQPNFRSHPTQPPAAKTPLDFHSTYKTNSRVKWTKIVLISTDTEILKDMSIWKIITPIFSVGICRTIRVVLWATLTTGLTENPKKKSKTTEITRKKFQTRSKTHIEKYFRMRILLSFFIGFLS